MRADDIGSERRRLHKIRQIEPKQNRVPLHFTRDGLSHDYDLTPVLSFPSETTAVLIQAEGTGQFGVKPKNTSLDDAYYTFTITTANYTVSQPVLINVSGSVNTISLKSSAASGTLTVSLIAEFGGEGFVPFPDTQPAVSAYVQQQWRTETITPIISGEDTGNVAAILGLASLEEDDVPTGARGLGSTATPCSANCRFFANFPILAPVDGNDQLEIIESPSYPKGGGTGPQSTFVLYVGYFKRGAYDPGDGKTYRLRTNVTEKKQDAWRFPSAYTTVNGTSQTSSAAINVITWSYYTGATPDYSYGQREIGSTDPSYNAPGNAKLPNLIITDFDASKNLQVRHPTDTLYNSYTLGWLEEQPATIWAIKHGTTALKNGTLQIK